MCPKSQAHLINAHLCMTLIRRITFISLFGVVQVNSSPILDCGVAGSNRSSSDTFMNTCGADGSLLFSDTVLGAIIAACVVALALTLGAIVGAAYYFTWTCRRHRITQRTLISTINSSNASSRDHLDTPDGSETNRRTTTKRNSRDDGIRQMATSSPYDGRPRWKRYVLATKEPQQNRQNLTAAEQDVEIATEHSRQPGKYAKRKGNAVANRSIAPSSDVRRASSAGGATTLMALVHSQPYERFTTSTPDESIIEDDVLDGYSNIAELQRKGYSSQSTVITTDGSYRSPNVVTNKRLTTDGKSESGVKDRQPPNNRDVSLHNFPTLLHEAPAGYRDEVQPAINNAAEIDIFPVYAQVVKRKDGSTAVVGSSSGVSSEGSSRDAVVISSNDSGSKMGDSGEDGTEERGPGPPEEAWVVREGRRRRRASVVTRRSSAGISLSDDYCDWIVDEAFGEIVNPGYSSDDTMG